MASISVDLIVEAIGKGFDKINSNLKETGNAVEDAGGAAESGGMKFTELASALSIAKQGFDLVAQGAKFAYDNIKEGAELELARSRFDNLAGSIGTTSDALLNDMRRATNGMQSDAELIAGATDIINLGLANTQEGTVRLATAVGTLGLDMQQVVLTFANNSKARLDALGLSVEDVTKKAEELEAQGFQGDAFDEAVLIGLEEKMTLLGDASETTAGQLQILESDWKNFTDGLKEDAAEIAGPVVSAIVANRAASELLRKEYEAGRLTYLEYQQGVSALKGTMQENAAVLADYGVAVDEAGNSLVNTGEDLEAMERQAAALREELAQAAANEIREYHQAMAEAAGVSEELTDKQAQLANQTAETSGVRQSEIDMIREANAANQAYFDSLEETAQIEKEMAAAAAAAAAETGDLFTKFSEADGDLQFFNESLGELGEQLIYVGGRTSEQNSDLGRLQEAYNKAAETVRDYELGIKGANLTDEARAEKIAEQQELMAGLAANMEPLLAIHGEMASVTNELSINQDAVSNAMIAAADAAGADAAEIALLKVATGQLSEEQAAAVIKSVALEQTLQALGAQYADGTMTLQEYISSAQQAVNDISSMTVEFDTQAGSVQSDNAAVAGLIETMGQIPDEIRTHISITSDPIPNLPTSAGSTGAGNQGTNAGVQAYASGTDGWQTVPGPVGRPWPVVLHGGEDFNVVPAGQSGTSGGGNSGPVTINVYQRANENGRAFADRVATIVNETNGQLK